MVWRQKTCKSPRPPCKKIIREYTREAGVRNLEREIANVCRKIVKKVVEKGKKYSSKVSPSSLYDMLGIPKFQKLETIEPLDIGVATGMAWTEFGGDLLSIEVTAIPGKGKMVPTGQLGDVMKESAHAAMTYVRSRASEFGLAKGFYHNLDIHLHIPEGAVPKGWALCRNHHGRRPGIRTDQKPCAA